MISDQFSHPLLVAAHDSLNALAADRAFWLALVDRLAPGSLVDFGCGTGLLTRALAAPGREVTGVDPAPRMLDRARAKPGADGIRWIDGGREALTSLRADLVLMTSHVAQLILEDDEWRATLGAVREALRPGGRLAFDCRARSRPPFPSWPTEAAPRRVHDATLGPIDWHHELLEVTDARVRYRLHFHFAALGERVTSTDELAFRSRDEITRDLAGAGLAVEDVTGDWDGSPATDGSPELIVLAARA